MLAVFGRAALVVLALTAFAPDADAACVYSTTLPAVITGPDPTGHFIPFTASSECPSSIAITSSADWLTVSSTANVSGGQGVIQYGTTTNATGAARTATISVGGQALVTMTQDVTPCVSGFTPSPLSVPGSGSPSGGSALTIHTTSASCQWSATSIWQFSQPSVFRGTGETTMAVTVPPNSAGAARSGQMTFGGRSVTVAQAGAPCLFSLSTPSPVSVTGGTGTLEVTGTGPDCTTFTATGSGAGLSGYTTSGPVPGTITFTMAVNPEPFSRTAEITVGTARTTIRQNGPPVRIEAFSLIFAVVKTPTPIISPPEDFVVAVAEQPSATWTAEIDIPGLLVTPSGQGGSFLRVSVDPAAVPSLTPRLYFGTITMRAAFAPATSTSRYSVYLNVVNPGTTRPPRGTIDTPAANATGLSGAIPITGWAVDDVGIAKVQIFRDSVGAEPPGGVFIGDATRVQGARPDLVSANFAPENRRAGWGYMLLSNVLPNGGNGPFTFSAYAEDLEGNLSLLGRKAVTIDNAAATRPFGTIDVPAQGETVSGTITNRGWVLTPAGKTIPFDGSTIKVYIDGVFVAPVTEYNRPRADVKAFFPNLANSNGPEARLAIDTTTIPDGVHTIAWGVIDDAGAAEGIGSRFFTVRNGASSLVIAPESVTVPAAAFSRFPLLKTDMWSRAGVEDDGWATRVAGGVDGGRVVTVRAGERLELFLDPMLQARCGVFDGRLVTGDVAGALPGGASLDAERGIFRWQTDVAARGEFTYVFLHRGCDGVSRRVPLRVHVVNP